MKNHCKLNPCCADPYDCKPPPQYGTPEGDAIYKRQMEASASPSPVDSRDGLIERLVKALRNMLAMTDPYREGRGTEAEIAARRDAVAALNAFDSATLAAKEQQP